MVITFEKHLVVGASIIAVLWGEFLLIQQKLLSGVLLYSLMLLALLLYGAYRWESSNRQLIVLIIPAVVRLTAFSLPLGYLSPLFAQMIVSVPLVFMAVTFVWLMKQGELDFHIEFRRIPIYLLLIVVGAGVGFVLFQIQPPARLVWDTPLLLFFYSIVLVAGMAFLEEWLFRGIMQTAMESLFGGGFAVLAVAIFYFILNIGQGSLLFVSTIFLFSIGLGWVRHASKGLIDVCLVHGMANIMFFLILPWM